MYMQCSAGLYLDVLEFASGAHAAPADAAKHTGMEGNDFANGIRFEFRAEGERSAEASRQKKDDKHNDARHN